MKNTFLSLFSGGIDKVVNSIDSLIDNIHTSDEEKQELRNKLEDIRLNAKLKATDQSVELEKEITKRWSLDKDHLITRAVRPATVLWSYFLFTLVLLFDGNIGEFHINQAYIPMLETILVTVTIAYFGSRGVEKVTKTVKDSDINLF